MHSDKIIPLPSVSNRSIANDNGGRGSIIFKAVLCKRKILPMLNKTQSHNN